MRESCRAIEHEPPGSLATCNGNILIANLHLNRAGPNAFFTRERSRRGCQRLTLDEVNAFILEFMKMEIAAVEGASCPCL